MITAALTILAIVLLLLVQGFFSGSEIAIVSCNKAKLRHRAKQGESGSSLALKMLEQPEVILTTTLVGTNIALVVTSVLGTALMTQWLGALGSLLAIIILTLLTLVIGEVVPKSVFQQQADALTPRVIFPLYLMSLLLFPVIFLFSRIARLIAKLVGTSRPGAEMFAVREQLRAVLESSEAASPEHLFDRLRIRNVVRFGELVAGDLMTPASEMIAVDSSDDIRRAIDLARRTGLAYLPVFEGKRSNIVGFAHLAIWDLVDPQLRQRSIADVTRPAYFVPVQQPVAELLPALRPREDQSAIVVDEFGSVIGLVTVQMILESIVGNIEIGSDFEDRTNAARPGYEEVDDDVYLVDARLPITDVNDLLATNISTAAAHSIGGLLVARLRHVPKIGEFIVESGYVFTVVDATDRAVTRLRITRSA